MLLHGFGLRWDRAGGNPNKKPAPALLGAAPDGPGAGFGKYAKRPAPYVGGQVQAQSQRVIGRFICALECSATCARVSTGGETTDWAVWTAPEDAEIRLTCGSKRDLLGERPSARVFFWQKGPQDFEEGNHISESDLYGALGHVDFIKMPM